MFDLNWPHIRLGQQWAAAQPETDQAAARLCNPISRCSGLLPRPAPAPRAADRLAAGRAAGRAPVGVEGSTRATTWATWAMPMPTWARWTKPSSTTSRRWSSPVRSATAAAKGTTWATWAMPIADLGQVDQAIEHYQQALVIAREIGDRRGEGNRLGNLGIAYCRPGPGGPGHRALPAGAGHRP